MVDGSLLLIQVGTPPLDIRERQGDLADWFCAALGCQLAAVDVVRVFEGERLPPLGKHRAAIITGSWAMVTDQLDWSEATAQWIREAVEVEMPLFGVCYGHQLMAHALGGRVGYHPAGLEIGCQGIDLHPAAASDELLQDMPLHFRAHLTHLQTVLETPHNATVLARSSHDAHQVVRWSPKAISTQFHPEFTTEISAACVMRRADMLRSEGRDPSELLHALEDTPFATGLLKRFVETYCAENLMR